MKMNVSILVETPLLLNTDLIEKDLLADGCKVVTLAKKQFGITPLMRQAHLNQLRCFQE